MKPQIRLPDRVDKCKVILRAALDGDKEATATIQSLHGRRDRSLGETCCMAFIELMDEWRWSWSHCRVSLDPRWRSFNRTPPATTLRRPPRGSRFFVDKGHDYWIDLELEAFGYFAQIKGIGILLDGYRRWWVSVVLTVDGVDTAILRRFGKHGWDAQNLIPRRYRREWRRFLTMDHGGEFVSGNGRLGPLDALEPFSSDIELEPYLKPGEHLRDLIWEPWEGWSPAQALAAHLLGLTRWGCGTWL